MGMLVVPVASIMQSSECDTSSIPDPVVIGFSEIG